MRIRPILAIWPLLPVLGGCSDLTEIEFADCGNNVLDPGEDCDGYDAGPDTHCIAPRQPAECHFSCGPSEEGQAYLCPEGMGCGIDWICREAAGTFAAPQVTVARSGRWMHLGAFDGDGRADLATLRGASLEVHYFGATGQVEQSFQTLAALPRPNRPVAGDLSGDGLYDLVLPGEHELSVLVASSTRTFRPKTYLPIDVPGDARV
ncbi:MAG: VCBS repeat-containing protein, partial [Deltaproteobacteria bacterium]|nr:VCBS repeat-containing protein [Deltaproteobacteria bacterium]